MVRFEKELQQKELRQEMKFRLTRLQQQQQYQQQIQLNYQQSKPHIIIGDPLLHGTTTTITKSIFQSATTPSPLTPGSTDELLPAVDESQEVTIYYIFIFYQINNVFHRFDNLNNTLLHYHIWFVITEPYMLRFNYLYL